MFKKRARKGTIRSRSSDSTAAEADGDGGLDRDATERQKRRKEGRKQQLLHLHSVIAERVVSRASLALMLAQTERKKLNVEVSQKSSGTAAPLLDDKQRATMEIVSEVEKDVDTTDVKDASGSCTPIRAQLES
jgi:hypothetical protein